MQYDHNRHRVFRRGIIRQYQCAPSHLLNGMLWATELKPVRVYAEVDNRGQEVDVCSSLSIRFDNGAVGNIAISGETFMKGMTSRLIITGTRLELSTPHAGQELHNNDTE